MSSPVSCLPEEDYYLNELSQISLKRLFTNGLLEDYLWLREVFALFCKTQKLKPYQSNAYEEFIFRIRKGVYKLSNLDQRRLYNTHVKYLKAMCSITDDLVNSFSHVGYTRVSSKSYNESTSKGPEYLHRVYLDEIIHKTIQSNAIIEIGAGAKSKYGLAANYDKLVGKDINSITDEALVGKVVITKQSVYHVKPETINRLLSHPMIIASSFFSEPEVTLGPGTLIRKMSGRIGKRVIMDEYNYDPKFFREQGFDVYTDFMSDHKPAPFITTNISQSPNIINGKDPVAVVIKPIGQGFRPKMPKNVLLEEINRPDLFVSTSFYQTHKIDGIPGVLSNEKGKVKFVDRTGTIYTVTGMNNLSPSLLEVYVEMIPITEEERFTNPSITCFFYFSSLNDGWHLWDDIETVSRSFPQIGFKTYKKIPYKSILQLESVSYPSDGVVYIPVLSFYKRYNNQINPMATHFFFKPCPTVDVTYAEVKSQRRDSRVEIVFWDEGIEKEYSNAFAQYNESNLNYPFIYEMSSYLSNGRIKRVITHVRMDKRKYDFLLPDVKVSARNEKGVFFFTQYSSDYEQSVLRFFLSLSKNRKALPFNFLLNQDKFYALVLEHLKKKFLNSSNIIEIDSHVLYDYLKTVTSSQMALFFVDLTMKNARVGKDFYVKNLKVYQTFSFNFNDIYDLKGLFKKKKDLTVQKQIF